MVIINTPKRDIYCRYFKSAGGCKRGNECWYIHDDNKYERCVHYHSITGCCYGTNCFYLHQDQDDKKYDSDIQAAEYLLFFINSNNYDSKSESMRNIETTLKSFADSIISSKKNANFNILQNGMSSKNNIENKCKLQSATKINNEYDKSALTLKVNHNNGNISHPVSKMNTINNNNKDVISPTISNEYNLSEINNIKSTKINKYNNNNNNDKMSLGPSLDDNQIIESSLDHKQISGSSHDDKQNKMIINKELIKSKSFKQYKNNNSFKKKKLLKKKKQKNKKTNNNKKKLNKKLNKTTKDISIINDVAFNDIITEINEYKETGNNYFMNNNFINASFYYHKARDLIDKYIPDMDENDNLYMNKIENLNELMMKIDNNCSAICLKEKQYEQCIKYATKVLIYDGKNKKALSRRCEAAAHLGIHEIATKDIQSLISINGNSKLIENLNKMIEDLSK